MNDSVFFIFSWVIAARGASPIQNDNGAIFITLLIALPIVALIFGAQAFDTRQLRRRLCERTAAMRRAANELGWVFDEDCISLARAMDGSDLGSFGHSHSVTNLIVGQYNGVIVKVFDFSFVVPSGKSTRTVCQTIVDLPRAGEKRPKFFLQPERAWWKRPLFESYQDFDFASHPVFSNRYQLSSNDEDAVRELFAPQVLEFFEQHEGLLVEASGERLKYYREEVLVERHEIRSVVDEALFCCRLLEESVN